CSKQCGAGYRKRRVRCIDRAGKRVGRELCPKDGRPNRREQCFLRNCLPSDCAELKAQNTQTNSIDGNYTVLVAGFRVHVYCYRMNETLPKTYLNVPPTTNFAEFYPKRLAHPYTCSSCEARACTDDGHVKQGRTRFRKLRIDLQNMKVNPNDFTFAVTEFGNPVTFGTAGDCFSMTECPKGSFSIDLRDTGLKIADDLTWTDHGHKTYSNITRSENNAYVRGVCGGYCGECAPDKFKGLVIEVDQKQRPIVGVG
ncbi:Thrombospondin type 1 domain containing protein, partial [Aphelenchoides avenae]